MRDSIVFQIKRRDVDDDSYSPGFANFPWASLSMLGLSLPLLLVLIRSAVVPTALLLVLWVSCLVLLPVFELIAQRDYVTSTSLVRRSGLLGIRCLVLPLQDLSSVEVVARSRSNTGTLLLRFSERSVAITCVTSPDATAKAILGVRDSAAGIDLSDANHGNP